MKKCKIDPAEIFLTLLIILLFDPGQAVAWKKKDEPQVRVALFSTRTVHKMEIYSEKIEINGKSPVNIQTPIIITSGEKQTLIVRNKDNVEYFKTPTEIASEGTIQIKINGLPDERRYRGRLKIFNTGQKLIPILTLDLESYTAGVVWGEMPMGLSEALSAQAVACRTFAFTHRGRHRKEGFDFCDSTHCQFYRGYCGPGTPYFEATMRTRGLILFRGNRPASGFYHSACGGATTAASDAFGGGDDGSPGVRDMDLKGKPFCVKSIHNSWSWTADAEDLSAMLGKEYRRRAPGRIREVKILKTDPSGRVKEMVFIGDRGPLKLTGYDFWQLTGSVKGWGVFKSALFSVRKTKNGFLFKGRGLGHGVGLCQEGAMEMAKRGYDFHRILLHYYPGTKPAPLRPFKGNL